MQGVLLTNLVIIQCFFSNKIILYPFCIGFTITLATPEDDAFLVGDGGCSKDCETDDSWLLAELSSLLFNSFFREITFSFDFVLIFVWKFDGLERPPYLRLVLTMFQSIFYSLKKKYVSLWSLCLLYTKTDRKISQSCKNSRLMV